MIGKLFVISAPSGTGKTTIVRVIVQRMRPHYSIERVVTYTSRSPRQGEKDGRDYHFISKDEFEQRIQRNFFIEWSTAYGYYYGSARSILEDLEKGKSFILIIDRLGARQILSKVNDVILLWLDVSHIDVLKKRLEMRDTETDEQIKRRLALAQSELREEQISPVYHYHVLNDNFRQTVKQIKQIMCKELEK